LGPSSENVNSLVVLEDIFVDVNVGRLNRTEVSYDMSPVVSTVDSRGVESVVIRRR
jgi:hypothetical protein